MKIGTRGLGRLYKRDGQGHELPATSKARGVFWLESRDSDGRRVRRRLEVDGIPVTDLKTARDEQMRIRAPYLTRSRADAIIAGESALRREIERLEREEEIANPPLSLSDAWERFRRSPKRRECGSGEERNLLRYFTAFRRFLLLTRPEVRFLRDVTESIAMEFCSGLSERFSAGTYNKYLGSLKMIFRVVADEARIEKNPFDGIPRKKDSPHSKRPLTIEELKRVVFSADGELRLILLLGMGTGLRFGDCATLRWCEVDLDAGIIRRVPNKTKRSSGAEVVLGIPAFLLGALVVQRAVCFGEEYVLPESANLYMSGRYSILSRRIQAHFRLCGIRTTQDGTGAKVRYDGKRKIYDTPARAVVEVGFHSLRHTWVTMHAEAGTPQALIQQSAGHSNPMMTEHYTHTSPETARAIAEHIDIPLSNPADEEFWCPMDC